MLFCLTKLNTTASAVRLKSLGHKSKNDKIDARGLAQMGAEQNLDLWQPLSKNIYDLRMLTRQHQRLQELKNQSENQKHALLNSRISDEFIIKQLDRGGGPQTD